MFVIAIKPRPLAGNGEIFACKIPAVEFNARTDNTSKKKTRAPRDPRLHGK
jgi:hypothetical protein